MLNLIKKIRRNRNYLAIDLWVGDLVVLGQALTRLNYRVSKIAESNLGADRVKLELSGIRTTRLDWRKFAQACDELPFKCGYTIQIFG